MLLGKPGDCLFLKSSPPHSTSPAWELRPPRLSPGCHHHHHHYPFTLDDCPFGCLRSSFLLLLLLFLPFGCTLSHCGESLGSQSRPRCHISS